VREIECPTYSIVDDNAENVRQPLKRQLGRAFGVEAIIEAENGQEALAQVETNRPEVIILDIMMPVMDGLEACKAIREDPDNAGVYIIMFTGRDGGLAEGLETGADIYLRKPCDIEELIAIVGKGLQECEKNRNLLAEKAATESRSQRLESDNKKLQQESFSMIDSSFPDGHADSWLDMTK
jgi:CheY-like chemotaxis protein